MRLAPVLALVALAACIEGNGVSLPPPGTAVITFGDGGPFNGGTETQVYANDVIVHTSYGPFDRSPDRRVRQGWPGAFGSLRATLAAEGPATARRLSRRDLACPDYGSDFVTAEPPVAGISELGTACPDPAMAALLSALRAALVRPE